MLIDSLVKSQKCNLFTSVFCIQQETTIALLVLEDEIRGEQVDAVRERKN
jgi:hypothetical protein